MVVLYYSFIFLEIIVLGFIAAYAVFSLYSWLKGAPYVPTNNQEIETILKQAQLQTGQYFLELGCGDGRVLRKAAEQYGVKGKGVDINPLVLKFAQIKASLKKLKDIQFTNEDVRKTELSQADVIYIFLFPELVSQIRDNLLNNTKQQAMIIAHGFKIPFLQDYLDKTIEGKKFRTYFYIMKK